MNYTAVVLIGMFAFALGVSGYACACAWQVWWKRNGRFGAASPWLRGLFGLCLVSGVILLLYSAAPLVWRPSGAFRPVDLYALRLPTESSVEMLTDAGQVRQGDVIGRFSASIPRALQELDANCQNLKASLSQLTIERSHLLRERERERVEKEDAIQKRSDELSRLDNELPQAQARAKFSKEQLERSRFLFEQQIASAAEIGEREQDLKVNEAEVQKIQSSVRNLEEQRASLKDGLLSLSKLMVEEQGRFDGLSSKLEAEIQEVVRRRATIIEAQGRPSGATNPYEFVVTAPVSGKVIYRADAPRSVSGTDPLLILSPSGSVDFAMRVPRWQEPWIRARQTLLFEVQKSTNFCSVDLARRFRAVYQRTEEFPEDSSHVRVLFAAAPHKDFLPAILDTKEITAALLDVPPVYRSPACLWGLECLGAAAVVPWVLRKKRAAAGVVRAHEPLAEQSSESILFHLLYSQLRNIVFDRRLDPHVLSAAEWALDRHGVRAIRSLNAKLAEDPDIVPAFHGLLESGDAEGDESLERLLNILKPVATEELRVVIEEHKSLMDDGVAAL